MIAKTKEFRDVVHGYVSVPAEWCAAFIDTPIFQRLKYVEQTSMRPLYPCARHDRFSHSLGVYHLARTAFQRLTENTEPGVLEGVKLEQYETAFVIAALMHDCAHAPFSHTFESHYNRNNRAEDFLLSRVDQSFHDDYQECKNQGRGPAEHEVFSAAVFLKHYREAFRRLAPDSDPLLVARMITGCVHNLASQVSQQVEDCLIQLINGPAIDLDKLDYVVRDTSASGVNNVSIDIQRLLSSLELVQGPRRLVTAYRRSALSVLESVLDGRNYLFRWVYSHHTVQYYAEVLRNALNRLDEILVPDKQGAFLDAVFSKEAFDAPVPFAGHQVFLPCDYDILSLLKQYKDRIPEVNELLERTPALVPLWKTQAEFDRVFAHTSERQRTSIRVRTEGILRPLLGGNAPAVMVISVKPKVIQIENRELFVKFAEGPVAFEGIGGDWNPIADEKRNVSFFYVYIPRQFRGAIPQCIEKLRTAPV